MTVEVLVSKAVTLRRMPPSTIIGTSEAPLILVSKGKIVLGLIFRLVRIEYGTTVSWAPVSQTAGLLLDLPGL